MHSHTLIVLPQAANRNDAVLRVVNLKLTHRSNFNTRIVLIESSLSSPFLLACSSSFSSTSSVDALYGKEGAVTLKILPDLKEITMESLLGIEYLNLVLVANGHELPAVGLRKEHH